MGVVRSAGAKCRLRLLLPATATPTLDINRLLGILSGSADDGADTLDGLPLRIIKKMRVPARCDRIRVAQKRADQRQARAAAGQLAGERMPQIMNSQAGDTGGLGELPPITLDIDPVPLGTMAGKDVFTQRALRMLGGVRVANLRQQLPRRSGKGRFMRRILFDARRRFRPDALAEVEIGPGRRPTSKTKNATRAGIFYRANIQKRGQIVAQCERFR